MSITPADFAFIRALVHSSSAISLAEGQSYLVEARLGALSRREGFASLEGLIAGIRAGRDAPDGLRRRVVEAMTTNESSFFRDVHPFEALRKTLIPGLIARRAGPRRLRIWCAACSSGQEPYSLAMLLREYFGQELQGWDVSILATDLSTEVLEKAREGRYTQMEVNRGVPAHLLVKSFRKCGSAWHLNDEIRRMVSFERLNLMEPWPPLGPVDLALLRNVLIYFEADAKRLLLGRMAGVLAEDGLLFLGTAETTLNLSDAYDRVEVERAICYRPRANRSRNLRTDPARIV